MIRIGIYNRYWSTMGGGEKHVGTIAEVLLRQGYEVDLIRIGPVDDVGFSARMNLDLTGARWVDWPSDGCAELADRSADYDVFINSTYCSSMVSQAKRSMYLVFFPHDISETTIAARVVQKAADRLTHAGWPRLARMAGVAKRWFRDRRGARAHEFVSSYDLIMANSQFTASWVKRRWGCQAAVLPPPIDTARFTPSVTSTKRRLILSVGRFFAGGHNKKHLEMIAVFRSMYDAGRIPAGWEYHLAGSVHTETEDHRAYFARVQEQAQGYPIKILGNLGAGELLAEYQSAAIFWHGAGWGEDESGQPERMEHFGMTACEAMAAGAIPIVMPRGGPREVVRDGHNGFYFRDANELAERTCQLISMHASPENLRLSKHAMEDVEQYSAPHFATHFMKEFRSIL